MLVAIALTGVLLSLGTRTPVYGWVYQVFPPMQGLRAAARFGNLFLLAMAVLAAFGLAGLRRRLPARARRRSSSSLSSCSRTSSRCARRFSTRASRAFRRSTRCSRSEPGRVVLAEVPFYPPQGVFENGDYVLNSTAHWRPLMNGYSGYIPGHVSRLRRDVLVLSAGTCD